MIEVDFEKEAIRMMQITQCSKTEADVFLCAQDEYFDMIGLNVYEDELHHEHLLSVDIVVDDEEMCLYISSRTKLSIEKCRSLSLADLQYLEELGVVYNDKIEREVL
ncbi:hypothetical protein D7V86_19500 [bacterium D16-51]|nr:hypothetical protein D7V96_19720 [bacterium D16-59]RKI56554.1 hypothetical protein D7V86_19500 [bacterium D16-51]